MKSALPTQLPHTTAHLQSSSTSWGVWTRTLASLAVDTGTEVQEAEADQDAPEAAREAREEVGVEDDCVPGVVSAGS